MGTSAHESFFCLGMSFSVVKWAHEYRRCGMLSSGKRFDSHVLMAEIQKVVCWL